MSTGRGTSASTRGARTRRIVVAEAAEAAGGDALAVHTRTKLPPRILIEGVQV